MMTDIRALCSQIISADASTRYAAIVNKMGRIVAAELRKGVTPVLTEEERESYAMKAVLGKMTREDFTPKLGRLLFTCAVYKKVKRVDIPLDYEGSDLALLIVSFEFGADHESIIINKILPLLKSYLPSAVA